MKENPEKHVIRFTYKSVNSFAWSAFKFRKTLLLLLVVTVQILLGD